MRKIIIRNVGPLLHVDIELAKVNLIVGPQSSGKSCVLKIACYCTWVEKKIELVQSADLFMKDGFFIKELTRFHKLKGYFRKDSYIEYQSDFMSFSYDFGTNVFSFEWKNARWEYKRPKVSYIPAERNMVAVIPNWFDVKLYDDNIQSFMADWDRARKVYTDQLEILNLGVSYQFDDKTMNDKVLVDDDTTLELTNTSSGLQSLIPLFVHLNYIGKDMYHMDEAQSYSNIQIGQQFLRILYDEYFKKAGKTEFERGDVTDKNSMNSGDVSISLANIGGRLLSFTNLDAANECKTIYNRYIKTNHSEIFLEEPENNLFPPTQSRLVDWLLKLTNGNHASNLFVATHSPYMMTAFLEKELKDFRLFLEKKEGNKSIVVTASNAEVQEIYDDGIDLFYNIESYT